jgi:hypothetical protein
MDDVFMVVAPFSNLLSGRALDRAQDTDMGAAAAQVAGEGFFNLAVGGF